MTRYALYSRFEEKDGQLVVRTEYFSVQAGDAATKAGWELIGQEPIDEMIAALRDAEEHQWDRLRERKR